MIKVTKIAGVFACESESRLRSLAGDISTHFTFSNTTSDNLSIYWLDYTGKRVKYYDLAKYSQYTQQTYVSHPWVVVNSQGRCIEVVLPAGTDKVVTIE
jgi:von Hippel-Lindau disease tumor supressor